MPPQPYRQQAREHLTQASRARRQRQLSPEVSEPPSWSRQQARERLIQASRARGQRELSPGDDVPPSPPQQQFRERLTRASRVRREQQLSPELSPGDDVPTSPPQQQSRERLIRESRAWRQRQLSPDHQQQLSQVVDKPPPQLHQQLRERRLQASHAQQPSPREVLPERDQLSRRYREFRPRASRTQRQPELTSESDELPLPLWQQPRASPARMSQPSRTYQLRKSVDREYDNDSSSSSSSPSGSVKRQRKYIHRTSQFRNRGHKDNRLIDNRNKNKSSSESDRESFNPPRKNLCNSERYLIASTPHRKETHTSSSFIPTNQNTDPSFGIADAIEQTLNAVKDASSTNSNSRLVNRLTSAKSLPIFTGDPLQWINFKQTYELSSELGEYSARENVLRLFTALKGEAYSAVENLLATGVNDADSIMKTLELRFGNKNTILERVVAGVRKLPNLLTGAIDVVSFTTKLCDAVLAMKSVNDIGYLFNKDLLKEILKKLTPTMSSDFV